MFKWFKMLINNPRVIDYIKEANGTTMRMKVIEMGIWDMVATASVTKAHGLTFANIRQIFAMVQNDTQQGWYCIDHANPAGTTNGYVYISTTNIIAYRHAGAGFDAVGFDDNTINRGYFVIWYED